MFVLDASIAIKWFFKGESLGVQALEILNRLVEKPDFYLVPDLFYIEVSAVLVKKSAGDSQFSTLALDRLSQLGIKTVPAGQDLLQRAIELSCKFEVTLYDSIYLATAELMNAKWLTADEKATKKISKSLYLLLKDV